MRNRMDDTVTPSSTVENDGCSICEGKANMSVDKKCKVFYNPVQEFNRDISIAIISLFSEESYCTRKSTKRKPEGEVVEFNNTLTEELKPGVHYENGISILEALSASGLRSIRYAKEIPGVKKIVANDISAAAVATIKKNIVGNEVSHLVTTSHSDASLLMYQELSQGRRFDVIDLDPYGCPSRFLDAAVQSVTDGGCLLVTCTDMAVLCGNSPETCYIKYGAISLKSPACHEIALRIALQCIESHANRYGRYIVPLLSFSADFYIRLVVRVNTSPITCKMTTSKLSQALQCVGCKTVTLQPLGKTQLRPGKPPLYSLPRLPPLSDCPHCQGSFQVGGPIWSAEMHCRDFISRLMSHLSRPALESLSTHRRIVGILSNISQELDSPLYSTISSLCSTVHCEVIPLIDFRSALLNAGYRVSLSHCAPNSIKTDAPGEVVWDVVRCWVKEHPVAERRLSDPTSVACRLLARQPASLSFARHKEAALDHSMLRYQVNPTPHWGPGQRNITNIKRKNNSQKKDNSGLEVIDKTEKEPVSI